MQVFKISETVFPGAELQVSLRLSPQGLATFLNISERTSEPEVEFAADLDPLRRYMAAVASKLPELIDAGSLILLEHEIAQLAEQNEERMILLKGMRS